MVVDCRQHHHRFVAGSNLDLLPGALWWAGAMAVDYPYLSTFAEEDIAGPDEASWAGAMAVDSMLRTCTCSLRIMMQSRALVWMQASSQGRIAQRRQLWRNRPSARVGDVAGKAYRNKQRPRRQRRGLPHTRCVPLLAHGCSMMRRIANTSERASNRSADGRRFGICA